MQNFLYQRPYMLFRRGLILLAAWGLFHDSLVLALEPASTDSKTLQLTIEQAVDRGLKQNPLLRAAVVEIGKAKSVRAGTPGVFSQNPSMVFDLGPRLFTLGTTGASAAGSGNYTRMSYDLRIEQPVDIFGQSGARSAVANKRVAFAEARAKSVAAEIQARVRSVYVQCLVAKQKVLFSQQRVETAKRTYDAAVLRASAGASSEIEERIVESEYGRARSALLDDQNTLHRGTTELRALLDIPSDSQVTLITSLARPPPRSESLHALIQLAKKRRRDLVALRAERQTLDADIERLEKERLPTIGIAFHHERVSELEKWFAGGITISPPLFRRNQVPLAEIDAEKQKILIAIDVTERIIEREVDLAYATATRRREQVGILEDSVLSAAERAQILVLEGWRAGKFDIFRALGAQRDLFAARVSWLEALFDLWTTEITLDRHLGVLR